MVKVAINGFGRIGKQFFIACLNKNVKWDFVINSIDGLDAGVYSLIYDSVHPSLKKEEVSSKDGFLIVRGKKIKFYGEKDPELLPWKDEKVDLVIECTGLFTKRDGAMKHIKAGAKKVLISAPAKDHDRTIVYGVNNDSLKKEDIIISAGSCTTNCIAPMVKIINDAYKIKSAYFITTHAYTATQRLIDAMDPKDFRRGRAAAINIVPTSSGASISVVEAVPELKGKLDGYALRVPVINGSISNVFAKVEKKVTKEEINNLIKEKSKKEYKGVIDYTTDQIVSSDIISNPNSCIFESSFTGVMGDLVSIGAWYDNEFGYSNRLVDVANLILKK